MGKDSLAVEWVPIGRVFLSPTNPRHNEDAVDPVAASLRRFGWRQPLVARPSGEVIAGNTRLKAAKKLGMAEVPVVRFEGSDLEATAYAIADNKVHEFSRWDDAPLAELLNQLRAEDALDGVGFTGDDIDELLREIEASQTSPGEVDDPGPGELPASPTSREGDLWLLDDHRLLVGDSRKPETFERLMNGAKARLWSSDPPYAVGYDGNSRPVHDGKPSGKDWSALYDEVSITDLGAFLDDVFKASLPHLVDEAPFFVWHAHVQQPIIAATFERHGLLLHQVLVWNKPSATFGHSYYRWKHEPCAFGWKRGHKPPHGFGQLDSVWEADWDGRAKFSTFHPTSKPTRLFEIPMEQHTKGRDIVLECFNGSGSQILAAEKLGRRCYAIDIQPVFVDGTIDRWQKATGKVARLDGTNQTFDEVKAERGGGA